MRHLFLLLYFTLLMAVGSADFTFESTLYSEKEKITGHPVNTGTKLPDLTFEDETQNYTTLYTIVSYNLSTADDHWVLNLEGRGAIELESDLYDNPVYRNLYGSESINHVILSEASIDYYSTDFAWSIGRNQLDLDWLSGSFDSIVFYDAESWIETRVFWFINYYDFQYNYYTKYKDINDNKGIAGLYLQSGEALKMWEWALYYYHVFDQAYLGGVKFYKPIGHSFGINGTYNYLNAIGKGKLPSESFLHFWSEMKRGKNHYFRIGYTQTGKNGLTAMLRFGAHTFSPFYLTGALDRPEAKNLYLCYKYENNRLFFDTVGGITSYHDKMLENAHLVNQQMRAFEIDLHAGYALNDQATLTLGYMLLGLDEKDNLAFEQDLITLSLSVQYP